MADGTGWNGECCRSRDAEPDAKTHRGAKGPPMMFLGEVFALSPPNPQGSGQALWALRDALLFLTAGGGITPGSTIAKIPSGTAVQTVAAFFPIEIVFT